MNEPVQTYFAKNNPVKVSPLKRFNWLKNPLHVVFAVLGMVILFELFISARTLIQSRNAALTPKNNAGATVERLPSLSLVVVKRSYKVGEIVPVVVNYSTQTHLVDGIDLILHFDNSRLEATAGAITKGGAFKDYPVARVDNQAGLVTISGITAPNQKPLTGLGVFAAINFKAKAPGQATVSIDFTPELTTDSNITDSQTSTDILKKVYNLEVKIQ